MVMDPPLEPMTSSRYQIQNPSFDICKGFDEEEPETLDLNGRSESVKLKKYAETVERDESSKSGSFQWRTHENQTRKTEYEVESGLSEVKRTCVDCQTTKTPLWRGGPAGPKSLCNACGIRYRKKRRAALGLNTDEKEKRGSSKKVGVSLKVQLLALGGDVYVQRSSSTVSILQKKRKLAKEEEAAVLLMALSCGLLHA